MIRSIKNIVALNTKCNSQPTFVARIVKLPTYNSSNYIKKPIITDVDDDENLSFADLIKKGEEQAQKKQNIEEKRQNFMEHMNHIDAREIAYKNINATEKTLQDHEIQRNNKETFIYENKENPFFNNDAAALHRSIQTEEEVFRDWQFNFQKQNKRKPTFREMQEDPIIRQILDNRIKVKQKLHATVFKYRIN